MKKEARHQESSRETERRSQGVVPPPDGLQAIPGLRPEDQERSSLLRWTFGVALVAHALLFLFHFPNLYSPPQTQAEEPSVHVLKTYRPPKPKPEPRDRMPVRQTRKVFVPDPDPDGPEPIRDLKMVEDPIELPELDLDDLGAIPEAPPSPDLGPIYVSGEVRKPVKVFYPQPRYTEAARRVGIQGSVILKATINVEGSVVDVEAERGLPMGLTQEAVKAVQKWQFRPATLNGKPVAVYFYLTVHFDITR